MMTEENMQSLTLPINSRDKHELLTLLINTTENWNSLTLPINTRGVAERGRSLTLAVTEAKRTTAGMLGQAAALRMSTEAAHHKYRPTYPPTYIPTSLPTYLTTYLPAYLPTYLPTYLP